MPPKATVEGVESGRDMMLLINFIRTAKDFKPDLAEMAEIYGIADKKNVPRKINKVLAPHGFKWNAGKIEGDGVPEDEGEDGEDGDDVVPMTPAKATRKATRTPKGKEPKTPTSNKKRKIEEEEPEEEDADIAKSIEDGAVEPVSKDDDDDDDDGEAVDTAIKHQESTEED